MMGKTNLESETTIGMSNLESENWEIMDGLLKTEMEKQEVNKVESQNWKVKTDNCILTISPFQTRNLNQEMEIAP